MINTFLFDLDGTLIQSPEIIIKTFRMTFETFFPEVKLSPSEESNLLGHTLFDTFKHYTLDEKLTNELVDFYRKTSESFIKEELKAYPNAAQVLKHLKKKGKTVGVVTSKMRGVATYHLELTGLLPFIDFLVGYEDTNVHKPNPDPLLKALEYAHDKANRTVYVGDHENDIKAAKAANMLSCGITYGLRTKELLMENPDFVIDELNNIKEMI